MHLNRGPDEIEKTDPKNTPKQRRKSPQEESGPVTAGFVTTCLSLWRIQMKSRKVSLRSDRVLTATGGPC